MTKKQIGKILKRIRISRGITIYSITKDSKLKYETVESIENGSKNYTIDSLFEYCKIIGVVLKVSDLN